MRSHSRKVKLLFAGDVFEQLIMIVIALVAIIAAVAAYLEADAGARSDEALLKSQTYLLQSVGIKSRGEQEVGYALSDAYRQWLELDSLAFQEEQNGDAKAAERYRTMRDQLANLTPLLSQPYFDPTSGSKPDLKAFESDTYLVEVTRLTEHFANAALISDGWGEKGDNYVIHLTLLTVALFLYGLATTVLRKLKWYFVGAGSVIGAITLLWMMIVVVSPVESLPDEAIVNYAQGVGLAHKDNHEGAIAAFGTALEFAPDYANAYYERAKAHFDLNNYEQAAVDYEAALSAGREDVNVPWNLGWTYYLMGDFEKSVAMTQQALEIDPDSDASVAQVPLFFNLGLAQLAAGNIKEAQESYTEAATLAIQQVNQAREADQEPSATLWWYLGAASIDIDNLLDCLYEQVCEGTPPSEAIATSENLSSTAEELNKQVKNLTTALEYTGQVPPDSVAATVSTFEVVQAVYDDGGQIVAYNPLQTQTTFRGAAVFEEEDELANVDLTRSQNGLTGELFIDFDYSNIQPGQLIVVKVYVDGRESPGLRLVEEWSLESQGEALLPLTPGGTYALPPDEYEIEIYVDSHLVQQGEFTIDS